MKTEISSVLRGRESWREDGVTQRRVGTCRGQQSPRCCSWLFPGWDPPPWVTCPAETQRGGVRGHGHALSNIFYICIHWSAASSWNTLWNTAWVCLSMCVTWKTSVWLGLGCVCCSPACWEWCWFCHWDQTSLGRPWNWAPLWLLSPDTSGKTHRVTLVHHLLKQTASVCVSTDYLMSNKFVQTQTSFNFMLICWLTTKTQFSGLVSAQLVFFFTDLFYLLMYLLHHLVHVLIFSEVSCP